MSKKRYLVIGGRAYNLNPTFLVIGSLESRLQNNIGVDKHVQYFIYSVNAHLDRKAGMLQLVPDEMKLERTFYSNSGAARAAKRLDIKYEDFLTPNEYRDYCGIDFANSSTLEFCKCLGVDRIWFHPERNNFYEKK